jgi:hypothetical protein
MNKTEITYILRKALGKQFKIYTFNSNKPMPTGLKGLPDHLLINRNGVGMWWLEVKIGKDTEKPEQKIFREMIERIERKSKGIYYRQVNEGNLGETIQEIYGK